MEWINVDVKKPLAWESGEWDGRNSDVVIAQDGAGKLYIAFLAKGMIDGTHFEDWYTSDGWLINAEIVRWIKIPE